MADDSDLALVNYEPFAATPILSNPISPPAGLNVVSRDGTADVSWSPNIEADTAGYKVHWDPERWHPYVNQTDVGTSTAHTISDLGFGDHYITVTA